MPSSWRRRDARNQEIADELGYANRGTVHHIVHDALARDREDAVENHQQLELARLAALWDKAMAGDVEAAREVRAVIMAQYHQDAAEVRPPDGGTSAAEAADLRDRDRGRFKCGLAFAEPLGWSWGRR
ncbi:hypothetical protein [Terrabacter sp. BE26]|uniref:hypothetical protein n=1 Tax=Terrabacter sp. BE26 TaxID=2898152 RepID=UPI0035BE24A2